MSETTNNRARQNLLCALLTLALFLMLTSGNDDSSKLEQVTKRGNIKMLTQNTPNSYYLGPQGEPTGPEYEMAKDFADMLEVDLKVEVVNELPLLMEKIHRAEGDFIAANLNQIPEREQKLDFGPIYNQSRVLAIYRKGQGRPKSIQDLPGKKIAVISGSSHQTLLENIQRDDLAELSWISLADATVDDLFAALADKQFDVVLADENAFQLHQQYYPQLAAAFSLGEPLPIAWAFEKNTDDSLLKQARRFFLRYETSGELGALFERYYERLDYLDQSGLYTFMQQLQQRLPPLIPMFQNAALQYNLDWRFLAAMGYQESHWNSLAESPTGVRGIMMLTRDTAKELGINDRLSPNQSIDGGARYFLRMREFIPERIPEPDRTWMALAAYNIGRGHLEDARVLTQRNGGDPDVWEDVRKSLPLLSQQKWYKTLRYGYARGYEAKTYVDNIRAYYDLLIWIDNRNNLLLANEDSPIGINGSP